MKIAFAIPVKDVEDFRLGRALESNFCQTRQPDEGFVVDYKSQVENKEKYKSIISTFPKVIFIEVARDTEIISCQRMFNIAIKRTNCDYFVCTGADDIPSSNAYEVVEDEFTKNPRALLMCGRKDLPPESCNPGIDFIKDFEFWFTKGTHHPAPGDFQCFPVDWIKEVGGLDEAFKGWGFFDVDIIRRAKKAGLKIVWLDDRMKLLHIYHPLHEFSPSYKSSQSGEKRAYNDENWYQRNRDRFWNIEWDIIANQGEKWGEI